MHLSDIFKYLRLDVEEPTLNDTLNPTKTPNTSQKRILNEVCKRLKNARTLSYDDMLYLRTLLAAPYSNTESSFDILRHDLLRLLGLKLDLLVTFTNLVLDCPKADKLLEQTETNLLDALAGKLGKASVSTDNPASGAPLELSAEPRSEPQVSAAALSQFTKHFYVVGRYDAISDMLKNLIVKMSSVRVTDLPTIYIPFLQHLVALMLTWGVPFTEKVYELFFQSVLYEYFTRYVGAAPVDTDCEEFRAWKRQGEVAWTALKILDHDYLPELLGPWYTTNVEPRMTALKKLLKD